MAELIVALDQRDAASAFALVDRLPPGAMVKVGSVLFTSAGPGFVRALVEQHHPVFLDLKWHDIPNTVAGAATSAASLGVRMATVHASGGEAMIRAAVAAAEGRFDIIAVTVLTSFDAAGYSAATGRDAVDPGAEVARLTRLAVAAGVAGVVCSPREIGIVRPIVRGHVVVPGIRRDADAAADQRRVADPAAAVAAGATHLVIGRPISEAADPAAAYREFARIAGS
ncbi:MAG: orotidine-5'-phosphate decarboxylase [Gemmatimonadales bacterium]